MPSVDPRAAEIIRLISEFEQSVGAAEAALVVRDWVTIDALLDTQHALTASLADVLEQTKAARPQSFSDEVDRRIAGIVERRADQLRRLLAFNHLIKQRLTIVSRSREIRRVNVDDRSRPRVLDLLQ